MRDPAWLPPQYVNLPAAVAYALDADDAAIVTMARILGLCWQYNYERSPSLLPEQLAELTGRPRSTLYRHLKKLQAMGWIRVDQAGRRMILRPLVACGKRQGNETGTASAGDAHTEEPALDAALLQALAEIGVENPKRMQLAHLDIDPLWVYGWHLWAEHPHRRSLTNPVGNIILKLENGERPPDEFLKEADRRRRLEEWLQEQAQEFDDVDTKEQEVPDAEYSPDPVLVEMQHLWNRCLDELRLQMTQATFDTWLRSSQVVEASESHLTIQVRHAYAVDWLQHRLLPVIERTLARHADGELEITFVAGA